MKRLNSLGISNEELERYMKILEASFGLKWLEEKSDHPIQILWKRSDILSTNELYTLACSIETLDKTDPFWTKKQIILAKGKDKNNRKGAIFEFIGLNMMNDPEHPVMPARLNQAGYDGVLARNDGTEVRVSIKNYGSSSFQQSFERKAKAIEVKIVTLLKKYKYPPVQVLLDFPSQYPTEKDWKMLEDRIDEIFKIKRNDKDPFSALVEPVEDKKESSTGNSRVVFFLIIAPIVFQKEILHEKFQSYTVLISAAFHQNEYKNLFSKIDDACANLLKHSAIEDENTINSLLLHLPNTVSLDKCEQWLNDYFEEFPHKQITFLVLYQPVVAEMINTNESVIQHSCKFYIKKEKTIKGGYKFCIPVGTVSDRSVDLYYIAELPDGTKKKIILSDKYTYQHGEHYVKLQPDGKGGFYGNIKKLGNGVYTSIVLELPGQKNSAVIKGRFAPSDELLIL
ncbi:hypothetical protein [Chryseobacterium sp. SL1]|uniref:hypothetical protein n=1 Tax=Chryseobacterium sp. SL1 TaxID=2995159 RepID=UPI002276CC68|nr:hypothetical protein [Chryseobacterium sp. SL1]MCY1660111.1 hypothetical protein [Chryseobacterium sp. SL1]